MIPCLYTTQRSKKVKAWQDGYLQQHTDKKSVLFDYEQKVISRFTLKELKGEINTGIYLISVEDIDLCNRFNKEHIQTEISPVKESIPLKDLSKVKFEVPVVNNEDSIIRRKVSKMKDNIRNNEFEVIKIPTEHKKREINEEEAGFVIKKRINNTLLCLKEYVKLLDVTNPLAFAHKLSIDDLQQSLNQFLTKQEEYILRNETNAELECESPLTTAEKGSKTDTEVTKPTAPIKHNEITRGSTNNGRSHNEIVNFLDD